MTAKRISTVETTPEIENLRARLAHLSSHKGDLQRLVEEAREREGELDEDLTGAKVALAGGTGGLAEVQRARRALEDHRASMRDLEEALGIVTAEHGTVGARIGAIEHETERQRQEEASAPHRRRCDELIDEALVEFGKSNAGNFHQALRDRIEIRAELLTKFPLATDPGPIPLRTLVQKFGGRAAVPPPFAALADRILVALTGRPVMQCNPLDVEREFGISL